MFVPVAVTTWVALAVLTFVARDLDFVVFFGAIIATFLLSIIFVLTAPATGFGMPDNEFVRGVFSGVGWYALMGWTVLGVKSAVEGF